MEVMAVERGLVEPVAQARQLIMYRAEMEQIGMEALAEAGEALQMEEMVAQDPLVRESMVVRLVEAVQEVAIMVHLLKWVVLEQMEKSSLPGKILF